MAKKYAKRKSKKSDSKKQTPKALLILLIIVGCIIAAADFMGYDPIGWIKDKSQQVMNGFSEEEFSGNAENLMSVDFIDVGQGDCIFIHGESENMLIDCGEASESDKVIDYLKNSGVTKLDYVIGTHPHSDHMGGMGDVISSFDVGEVIMPYLPDKDIPTTRYFEKFMDALEAKNLTVTDAEVGRVIYMGDARAEIIAPVSSSYGNTNNYSVGIILTHGTNRFMFSGDAEKLAEEEMLESGKLKNVTVYKAGHHGSDTSSSENFIKALSPKYAVIMCGEGNSYGHPNKSTLETLEKYTEKIYRTDENGTIVCKSDGNKVTFSTER